MIVKAVFLFLAAMMVLAMFGRLRTPKLPTLKRPTIAKPRKCRTCGAPIPGKGKCPCSTGSS